MNLHHYAFATISPKRLIVSFLLLLSILLVAYGPMSSYSYAQSASDGKMQELKQKALTEIDRRIASYKKSLESIKADVSISKDDAKPNGQPINGNVITFTYDETGIKGTVALPTTLQNKVKQYMETMIKQLESLKEKVNDATTLKKVQGLAQNVDAQFDLDQVTQVQTTVTQSIESMTGVLDNLKSAYNKLQGQVDQIKDCIRGAEVSASASSDGSSVSCDDFNTGNPDVVNKAQSDLDRLSMTITTISTIVGSSVTLLSSLVSQYGGTLGELGNLSDVGNLSNISNLLGSANGTDGLKNLTESAGSMTGLLGSFTAITSQLDIAGFMSSDTLGRLSGLSDLINL
jgi:hypothetical protein